MTMLNGLAANYRPNVSHMPSRRYDLDWLRVLAFGLLIFYHVGMFYVENWGWHIKSQYLSSQLESLMLLLNPWRMPILWMISGIAIRFILARVSLIHFIKWRSYRLLLPLLFGILVVVPPQLYYEMSFKDGSSFSYWEFYSAFWQWDHPMFANYQPGIWPHIDVNHLWYLRELWTFSIYMLALIPLFNSQVVTRAVDWLAEQSGWILLLVLVGPIIAIQFNFQETKEPLGFLFLCYGYLLGWHPKLWDKLRNNAIRLLIAAIVGYIMLVYFYNTYWVSQNESTDVTILIIGRVIHSFDRLIWVLAILGLGYRFLNRPSSKLSYLNDAVYPFYILHQTAIIIFAFELSAFKLGGGLESVLVIALTFISLLMSYELIRRSNLLRPLFGLKLVQPSDISDGTSLENLGNRWSLYRLFNHQISVFITGVVILLFGLEILI
jgi:hypothetical protein